MHSGVSPSSDQSIAQPDSVGTAGVSSHPLWPGGDGGGALALSVGGTLNLEGTVHANGLDGSALGSGEWIRLNGKG